MALGDHHAESKVGVWLSPGCVSVFTVFLAMVGTAGAVFYANDGYTQGLWMVIAILLAGILMEVAREGCAKRTRRPWEREVGVPVGWRLFPVSLQLVKVRKYWQTDCATTAGRRGVRQRGEVARFR